MDGSKNDKIPINSDGASLLNSPVRVVRQSLPQDDAEESLLDKLSSLQYAKGSRTSHMPRSWVNLPRNPRTIVEESTSATAQLYCEGVKFPIQGVTVEYPFEPYPVQKYMMNQVLNALNKAQHCLVESPTGTGKTLALLCSSLAWQRKEIELCKELWRLADEEKAKKEQDEKQMPKPQRDDKQASNVNSPLVGNTLKEEKSSQNSSSEEDLEWFRAPKRTKKSDSPGSQSGCGSRSPTKVEEKPALEPQSSNQTQGLGEILTTGDEKPRVPRIFYGSRTHKQISQVVQQLKKTTYGQNIKMTVLGSREMTCVNEIARSKPNIDEACQHLVDSYDGCSYYAGVFRSHEKLLNRGTGPVFDIEDVVKFGRKHHSCPFFSLRNLMDEAHIIFCPYNYLIDPNIRKSSQINLAKSIVIIDEGHNIEDVCRDAGSLVLKEEMLETAMKMCEDHIRAFIKPGMYQVVKDYLELLNNWLTNQGAQASYADDIANVQMQSGEEIINKLHVEGITQDKFQGFLDSIDEINKKDEENENTGALSGILLHLCRNLEKVFNYLYKPENMDKYRAYISREYGTRRQNSGDKGGWLFSNKSNVERVWKYNLHVLCLSPAVVFSELLEARSIVLASGTLSPIDSFEQELDVKFPFVVHGRHVVPNSNVFVSAVSSGPENVGLKGIYEFIHSFQYQDELGRVILETAKIIPQGVLCFFPSYTLMEKLKQRWEITGLLKSLGEVKEVFWEPRLKREMEGVMLDYEARIEESMENPDKEISALLFGVFRGKIAEGIDFPDHFARVVISVGIPFPNRHNKDVEFKMKYNDSRKIALNGSRWYSIQAYRALNQAIGRCLRHKNDWGAIILLDSRFTTDKAPVQNLPKWIQSQVKHFLNFEHYKRSLSTFCEKMNQNQGENC